MFVSERDRVDDGDGVGVQGEIVQLFYINFNQIHYTFRGVVY